MQKRSKEIIDEVRFGDFPQAMSFVRAQILEQMIKDGYVENGTTVNDIPWEALFGTKNSANLKNQGMLIGFSYGPYSFRLDFDHEKGFHINYGNNAKRSDFCRAVIVEVCEWKFKNVYNSNPNLLLQNWSIEMKNSYRRLLEPELLTNNKSYQTARRKQTDTSQHMLGKNQLDPETLEALHRTTMWKTSGYKETFDNGPNPKPNSNSNVKRK